MLKLFASRPRSSFARYALATAAVLAAYMISGAMREVFGSTSTRLLIMLAILVSAWWGGPWAGIYATFLGLALRNPLIAPEFGFDAGDAKQYLLMGLFLFAGIAISILTSFMQAAQLRAEAAAQDARRNWQALLESDERAQSMAVRAVEWRRRFDALVESVVVAVYVWDPKTNRFQFDRGFGRLLGHAGGALIHEGDELVELVHPDDRSAVALPHASSNDVHKCSTTQYRLRHRRGEYLPVEDRRFRVVDSAGQLECIVGVLTNIAYQKQLEVDDAVVQRRG